MLAPVRKKFWNTYGIGFTMVHDFYHAYKPIIEISDDRYPLIMVIGCPRSGTTWLGDVLAKILKARQVFEPFNLRGSRRFYFGTTTHKLLELIGDQVHQLYVRPDSPPNEYTKEILSVLTTPPRNALCDKGCGPGVYRRRLIKDIRSNLFMAYIARSRPDVKIIWIVRNPMQVIESQMAMEKVGWVLDWNVDQVKEQLELLEDWLGPFLPEMEAAKSLPERLAHKWCIETYVPSKQKIADYPNVLLVRHDNLSRGPEEWDVIKSFLECETWDARLLGDLLRKPSRSSRGQVRASRGKKSASLSDADIAVITRIVKAYGLQAYISS